MTLPLTQAQLDAAYAVLRQGLAVGMVPGQTATAHGSPGHDNGIDADDGAPNKGDAMCRTVIFSDRGKWRVRVVDRDTGKATTHKYETEQEAKEAAPKLRQQYTRPVGVPMREALVYYRQRLTAKGNKARSIETTIGRLVDVFGDGEGLTGELTPVTAREAWQRYTAAPGRKTGKLPSTSTAANTLNESRTFAKWLLVKGWIKTEILTGIEVEGRRNRGKAQLDRLDDARKFKATAQELAGTGDNGALASLAALLLGLRASEIANTTVGDLDDGGRIWITRNAKTQAGDRKVMVPEDLRALVGALGKGRAHGAKLFGDRADRYWVRHAVRRVCRLAGVPVISAHGMRGTHASLAVAAGVSGLAVAASLGHESFAVTERHYASAESVSGARVDRVLEALN